jgi:hypothetical protein
MTVHVRRIPGRPHRSEHPVRLRLPTRLRPHRFQMRVEGEPVMPVCRPVRMRMPLLMADQDAIPVVASPGARLPRGDGFSEDDDPRPHGVDGVAGYAFGFGGCIIPTVDIPPVGAGGPNVIGGFLPCRCGERVDEPSAQRHSHACECKPTHPVSQPSAKRSSACRIRSSVERQAYWGVGTIRDSRFRMGCRRRSSREDMRGLAAASDDRETRRRIR